MRNTTLSSTGANFPKLLSVHNLPHHTSRQKFRLWGGGLTCNPPTPHVAHTTHCSLKSTQSLKTNPDIRKSKLSIGTLCNTHTQKIHHRQQPPPPASIHSSFPLRHPSPCLLHPNIPYLYSHLTNSLPPLTGPFYFTFPALSPLLLPTPKLLQFLPLPSRVCHTNVPSPSFFPFPPLTPPLPPPPPFILYPLPTQL